MSNPGLASRSIPALAAGVCLASALTFAACQASNGSNFLTGGAGGGGVGAGSHTGGGDIGFTTSSGGTGNATSGGSNACAAEPHVAEQVPLDMLITLDQSGSMSGAVSGGGTRWTAVTSALQAFVTQPGLAGIGVGIQYFGLANPATGCKPLCTVDADCGGAACGPCFIGQCFGYIDSCDPAHYSKAEVDIAPLPGAAVDIITSMSKHGPATGTPISPALQGGINYCKKWALDHPGHAVVLVFATDGNPEACDTNQANINAIAAAGASGTPKVLTFAIGVGSGLGALNQVAAAGGTGQAYIVDTNQNSTQQFIDALNAIRGAALGCQYAVPKPTPPAMADYGKVNVQYSPGDGGPAQVFDHFANKAACPPNGDGWYYDDNANPTLINLCDSTCNKVGADTKGKIDILLGCKTKEPS